MKQIEAQKVNAGDTIITSDGIKFEVGMKTISPYSFNVIMTNKEQTFTKTMHYKDMVIVVNTYNFIEAL